MDKEIELEGRRVIIECKQVEINGEPVFTPKVVQVIDVPVAQETTTFDHPVTDTPPASPADGG